MKRHIPGLEMVLDLVYLIYFLFYFPLLVLRGKWHKGFACRFGVWPSVLTYEVSGHKNIWVHAVSVGEVALVDGVIKGLAEHYPDHRIVLSVTTKTGYEFAARKYAGRVVLIWAPLDLSWVVWRFIDTIRPRMYVAAETELWPNLFKGLHLQGVPIVLVNGRISDEAYPRYQWVSRLLKDVMARIALVCAQSELDAQRFMGLGVKPEHVHVVGNVKFDLLLPPSVDTGLLKQGAGLGMGDVVWVAASTHPGEEDVVLDVFQAIRSRFPLLRVVMVPRHPERAGEIAALLRRRGLVPVLFTARPGRLLGKDDVLVVDVVGHLMSLYAAADIVFVGKSLGLLRRGGQNPVEPAAWGKPVIVGPSMENFKDVMRLLIEAKAVLIVNDANGLKEAVEGFLEHPDVAAALGLRARAVVMSNRGAVARTLEFIRKTA